LAGRQKMKKMDILNLTIGKKNISNRENWLKNTLKNLPNNTSILDAGAGELQYKKYCSHLKYTSQDFGQYDGKGDGIGLQTGLWDQTKIDLICDIINIPVDSSSFDSIMCIEVLEHLPDPAKAIEEFSRIIKDNGLLIITAPFCSFTHFAPYHYSTGFSKYYYEHHLKKNNFEIIEITPNGNYFEFLAQEMRRLNSAAIEYTGSKLSFFYKALCYLILLKLEKLEKNDNDSNKFLNYGYHVLARKNNNSGPSNNTENQI
jgi:SAM-dependent methyltransferase